MQKRRALFRRTVRRFDDSPHVHRVSDTVVAEEPFTLVWESNDGRSERLLSTMRTPGQDNDLAAGMLFSEQLIQHKDEIGEMSFCGGGGVNELNRLKARLRLPAHTIAKRMVHRPSYGLPQSSCGLCAVDDLSNPGVLLEWAASRYRGVPSVPERAVLMRALEHLSSGCRLFTHTGASHASVLLDGDGAVLSLAEDVGRHNACDKAIGYLILNGTEEPFCLPSQTGLTVSGRLSFDLAYKAIAAGVSWIASVGAPTHLAVELAALCEVPLVGFLSQERYNRYT